MITVQCGHVYRLTTHETADSGDPWYENSEMANFIQQHYNKELISIVGGCRGGQSSASFPSVQSAPRVAAGVPAGKPVGQGTAAGSPPSAAGVSAKTALPEGGTAALRRRVLRAFVVSWCFRVPTMEFPRKFLGIP